MSELKEVTKPMRILECLPECPIRISQPVPSFTITGTYVGLGSFSVEYSNRGICDTCLYVLRAHVFHDSNYTFNATASVPLSIITIPINICLSVDDLLKAYCRVDPISGKIPLCLCDLPRFKPKCYYEPSLEIDVPCTLPYYEDITYFSTPNGVGGGLIHRICLQERDVNCPNPLAIIVFCWLCVNNPNRLVGIANLKEDYEVLKALTLGTSVWELDFDITTLRRLITTL